MQSMIKTKAEAEFGASKKKVRNAKSTGKPPKKRGGEKGKSFPSFVNENGEINKDTLDVGIY